MCNPCCNGWRKLLKYLGKTVVDDESLPFSVILDSNGLEDALWCCHTAPEYNRVWRLYAVWCARQVQHLMTDQRSLNALDVAERHANGQATDKELSVAWDAAKDAWIAGDTARKTAWAAVLAAGAAAWAAENAARKTALAAAWATENAARKTALAAAWAAGAAAGAAVGAAAWATTWAAENAARETVQTAQAARFREIVSDI